MLDKVLELQKNAVDKLEQAFNSNKKVITFKSPTGSGKTFIIAQLMDSLLSNHNDIVFIVSSLSKANLAEQNHSKFKSFLEHGYVKKLKPFLISSETSGENSLYIPTTENVYSLPRDLYKNKSKLKNQQAFLRFLKVLEEQNKKIYLIKDECHIATTNLDELSNHFDKILNVSATPDPKRNQIPDVEVTEVEAISADLIKKVKFNSGNTSYNSFDESNPQYNELNTALSHFIKIKQVYHKYNINPCFIIQISNKEQGQNQFNTILNLLKNKYNNLKYISIANDPKLCSTNDQLIKANPNKWEKYAISNDSVIDVIIFKMVITEGWDIPRACMLFQIRDSQSKQLDEQVLGRVRRNPLLLNFEKVDEKDKDVLTTADVWGIKQNTSSNKTVEVNLKGNNPFIGTITNQIQNEIKILTTRLKDLMQIKSNFDIKQYLSSVPTPLATTSIFELYEKLNKSSNDIKDSCSTYCSSCTNYYDSWFKFNNNLNHIKTQSENILSNYQSSMEIVTDNSGKNIQYTLPFDSLYCSNNNFPLNNINNWIWNNNNQFAQFEFDSDAERKWLYKMIDDDNFKVKTVKIDNKDIKLLGKNFIVNSNIKYQYYLNGVHDSYPDFIMKTANIETYVFFEVKSLNHSSNQNIDKKEYEQKIRTLQTLYLEVSKLLTEYYFCLPILEDESWTIHVYNNGDYQQMNFQELTTLINSL